MKIRDKRAILTTEGLQGIRQIKFSAIENKWDKELGGVREKELVILWSIKMNNLSISNSLLTR